MVNVGSLSQPSVCPPAPGATLAANADGREEDIRAVHRLSISPLVGVLRPLAENTPMPVREGDQSRLGGGGTVPEPLVGWAIYLRGFYN